MFRPLSSAASFLYCAPVQLGLYPFCSQVIKSKSAVAFHFPLTLTVMLNCAVWSAWAAGIQDWHLLFTSAWGMLLCGVQVILCLCFWKNDKAMRAQKMAEDKTTSLGTVHIHTVLCSQTAQMVCPQCGTKPTAAWTQMEVEVCQEGAAELQAQQRNVDKKEVGEPCISAVPTQEGEDMVDIDFVGTVDIDSLCSSSASSSPRPPPYVGLAP